MIEGVVNSAYEPVVRLAVQGPSGQGREVDAVVDTGFNAFLSLPSSLVTELELPFVTRTSAFLADGTRVRFNVYYVTVLWDGQPRQVYVHMSDATPLLGMALLDSHNLNIDVEDRGRVAIERKG